MPFPRQGQLAIMQDDHMLHFKWNTSRHPRLNVNIPIRLLHCIWYHMILDRTSTEEMLFRVKRQTVLVKTLRISPLLSNIIFILSEISKAMGFFYLWGMGEKSSQQNTTLFNCLPSEHLCLQRQKWNPPSECNKLMTCNHGYPHKEEDVLFLGHQNISAVINPSWMQYLTNTFWNYAFPPLITALLCTPTDFDTHWYGVCTEHIPKAHILILICRAHCKPS